MSTSFFWIWGITICAILWWFETYCRQKPALNKHINLIIDFALVFKDQVLAHQRQVRLGGIRFLSTSSRYFYWVNWFNSLDYLTVNSWINFSLDAMLKNSCKCVEQTNLIFPNFLPNVLVHSGHMNKGLVQFAISIPR